MRRKSFDWVRRWSYYTQAYVGALLGGSMLFFAGLGGKILLHWFVIPDNWLGPASAICWIMAGTGALVALTGYLMILLIWLVRFLDS
ncbi:hypothetical protein ACKC9G_11760 [Pokkaliibacter sp. CJK22405]|uniref:hypothetical protein n=1 Tax=Pokkaliibacter sp. CJK22405 TaxID=3384615 RepID=UPI00398482EB